VRKLAVRSVVNFWRLSEHFRLGPREFCVNVLTQLSAHGAWSAIGVDTRAFLSQMPSLKCGCVWDVNEATKPAVCFIQLVA
jgi:hypothetical protein